MKSGSIRNDIIQHSKPGSVTSALYNLILNPSLQLMILYRISNLMNRKGYPLLADMFEYLQYRMFSCRISKNAHVGNGVKFAHPVGIIIGAAIIYDGVIIWQNVSIGSSGKDGQKKEYPVIHRNAKIYAGSVLVGGITVGENAVIGALSFVNRSVKDGATFAGTEVRE